MSHTGKDHSSCSGLTLTLVYFSCGRTKVRALNISHVRHRPPRFWGYKASIVILGMAQAGLLSAYQRDEAGHHNQAGSPTVLTEQSSVAL